MSGDPCNLCGNEVLVMAHIGSGYCSQNCKRAEPFVLEDQMWEELSRNAGTTQVNTEVASG